MNMNYYVCSVGESGKGYDDENLGRCREHCCWVMHSPERVGPIDQIRADDWLFLKYRGQLIAYGRAGSSLLRDRDISDGEGWASRVDVDRWIFCKPTGIYGIKDAQQGGSNYDTVKRVDEGFARQKLEKLGGDF